MDLGVMIEAQEGVTWDLWRRIATSTETLGFESLWRSDHFMSLSGPSSREALETFISLALVAELTERIRFGPLVASVTFRHPSLVARMAAQIDVLSGGRFVLGLGAGWNMPEHESFGIWLPPVGERMDRLDESIRAIKALWDAGPATFRGRYYRLRQAECYPKPVQRPLPLLVGGGGERRILRIVAEHAAEWNISGGDLGTYRRKRDVLARHCASVGRDPATIKHSQMMAFVIGRDEVELRRHLEGVAVARPDLRGDPKRVLQGLRDDGWLVGTPSQFVDELGRRQDEGISRVMLQHLASDNFEVLEMLAADVLPYVQRQPS